MFSYCYSHCSHRGAHSKCRNNWPDTRFYRILIESQRICTILYGYFYLYFVMFAASINALRAFLLSSIVYEWSFICCIYENLYHPLISPVRLFAGCCCCCCCYLSRPPSPSLLLYSVSVRSCNSISIV